MKKHWHIMAIGVVATIVITLTAGAGWARIVPDHSGYAALLKKHVKNGLVNYQSFKEDQDKLTVYLNHLSEVDPAPLSRSEQMAFYINAYNAWTIKLILDNYPGVKSIKELGSLFQSPWKKKFVKLSGETVSLDHVEHDILRPVYKDARIHFAINCAARSCPPLLADAYTGRMLDSQLDQMAINFINDEQSNYLETNTLYISSIFKWFREDFGDDVRDYIRSYARGRLAEQMEAQPEPKVRFLKYDWSLNGN